MIEEQLKEQASLYVVGALPASEARDFEEVLGGSLELQVFVTELRPSVEALAVALPRRTPSPAVRARLLREIDRRFVGAAVPLSPGPGLPLWALLPWGLAACATFFCIYLATQRRDGRIQVKQLEQRIQELSAQTEGVEKRMEAQRTEFQQQRDQTNQKILSQSVEQMRRQTGVETRMLERVKELERRNADLVLRVPGGAKAAAEGLNPGLDPLVPTVPGGTGVANSQAPTSIGVIRSQVAGMNAIGAVVWEPREQRGTITIDQLPVPASNRDYQLWLFADATPVSAGVLTVDSNGHVQANYRASHPVETVIQWAITLEKKGGSEGPEGSGVMATN